MAYSFSYFSYQETGSFSRLATDYLRLHKDLGPFYTFPPDEQGIHQAVRERGKYPVNRPILVAALERQYAHLNKSDKVTEHILALADENTYTVCTAHQPNLLTGYLYFIYKILHAIKLADHLKQQHPGKNFVPVYYMGSEDNDLEELGVFRFRGDKYVWDGGGQTGAVGRMSTASLKDLLHQLFKVLGPPGTNCDELQALLATAYLQHDTIGKATQYLVNELFGRFGLIVLDPDDAALKSTYIPVMENELLHQAAYPIITAQMGKLGEHYKVQAHPRPINLFYLADQIRERIEQQGDEWTVVNTNITWHKDALLKELHEHPERFSPNVMLRGMYQETILPNVAFIGGGAEVAYWLQLKTVFAHYHIYYPAILLRQSVLWIDHISAKMRQQLDLSIADLFKSENELVKQHVLRHSTGDWQTDKEMAAIGQLLQQLKHKAIAVDPTLKSAAEAALTKMKHQAEALEKKMYRAEKRKMQVLLTKLNRLKSILFPGNGLQERVENVSEYYLQYGISFLDILMDGIKPAGNQFLVVEHNQ